MKKQKKKSFQKIIHKCPFLILITVTTGGAMLFSKNIGVQAVYQETVSREIGTEQLRHEQSQMEQAQIEQLQMEQAQTDLSGDGISEGAEEIAGILQDEELDKLNQELINETQAEGEDVAETAEIPEETAEEIVGVTNFITYTPVMVDSIYYSDAGKTALTTEYPYAAVDVDYFNDAAFLGDSRTLGLSDYVGLDGADFFCENSMTIFKMLEDTGVTYQKTGEKVDLKKALQEKQYGKIYLMVGINELGYGNTERYFEQYRQTVEQIREWQPEAIIYVMGNLHVSKEKNNDQTEFNNLNINDKNAAIAQLANGRDIFYLDVNPEFTDENGFLNAELTFDGVHLYAQYYHMWGEFLMQHAVVK